MAIFEKRRIPAAPIHTIDKALALPQVEARHMLLTLTHPVTGTPLPALGNPVKMGGDGDEAILPPPLLGQHTEEVLRGWLALSDGEIADLRREKVI
jgi:crotonobetainyl-CoA:carnitine CoA-transferase CaiB-like acyl-CoA transferase